MFGAGNCLLIETNRDGGGHIQSHLHVVILDCELHTNTTVIVCVETLVGKKDKTTVLNPGDHDFIKHPSYVNYGRSKPISSAELLELLNKGIAKTMEPVTAELLSRLRKGILDSGFTPTDVLEYCRRRFSDEAFDKLI